MSIMRYSRSTMLINLIHRELFQTHFTRKKKTKILISLNLLH